MSLIFGLGSVAHVTGAEAGRLREDYLFELNTAVEMESGRVTWSGREVSDEFNGDFARHV